MYNINSHLTVGGGIFGLPGVRSTEYGEFPAWLPVDNRLIADEYFRPSSYTTGIWALGEVVDRLSYTVMLGNNLSQLGVDAGQLDNGLNTVSASLVWLPTTGEFGGPRSPFGDFQDHEKLATRFAAHYTYSLENYQGQPNTDNFENVQIVSVERRDHLRARYLRPGDPGPGRTLPDDKRGRGPQVSRIFAGCGVLRALDR